MANYILGQIRQNNAKKPLEELSNKQVHNIYMQKVYYKQDPVSTKSIPCKQVLKKFLLKKLDFVN